MICQPRTLPYSRTYRLFNHFKYWMTILNVCKQCAVLTDQNGQNEEQHRMKRIFEEVLDTVKVNANGNSYQQTKTWGKKKFKIHQ